MDVLDDYLRRARTSAAVIARSLAHPPWGLSVPGGYQLVMHVIAHGEAWIWFDEPDRAVTLITGDIVLVRSETPHRLAYAPGASCLELGAFEVSHRDDGRIPGKDETVFVCGAYQLSGDVGADLLDSLPALVRVPATPETAHITALISGELAHTLPGQHAVLDWYLSVLLVYAIRHSFSDAGASPRWYEASIDPHVSASLRAMHTDVAHAWSVSELAAISGLSRSAYARRFQRTLGQAPLQYLTDWRMTIARDTLRNGDQSILEIAQRVGYSSPYAFAAAFRRHHGVPPGRWRHRASGGGDV